MAILVETDEPYALSPKAAAKRLNIDVSTLYRHYGAARHGASCGAA
jgi:hypothetical protein